jgi:hypothetical protein
MDQPALDDRGGWGPLAEPVHGDRPIRPGDPPWRENAWLAFYDRPQGVYSVTHLTTSPNAGGRRARCSLVADGREAEIVEALPPMEWGSPSIGVDLTGHIAAKGPNLAVDMTLTPRHHPCDYSQSQVLPGVEGNEPLQHFQQTGTATGTVTLGDVTLTVDGAALRDRTWGFRDEAASWVEYYACLFLFDDFDLAIMKFRSTLRDDEHVHGFLMGGRQGQICGSRVVRDAWGGLARMELDLTDGGGVELTVDRPEARIFVPLGEPTTSAALSAYDDFAEVRTADGAVGFGAIEQGILRRLG